LSVGWVWLIAGGFLLFYFFLVLLIPRPVQACVDELSRRPATTFLMGVLTQILLPVVSLILIATGLGALVVPFLIAALIAAMLVGKAAVLQSIGGLLVNRFNQNQASASVLSFVLGAVLVTALYLIPFLGLIAWAILTNWAIGAAILAAFGGLRREMPERKDPPPTPVNPTIPGPGPASAYTTAGLAAPMTSDPSSGAATTADPLAPPAGFAPASMAAPPAAPTPVIPEAVAYPKARFWERMGAAFLDIILVSILGVVVDGPPLAFLVALAYFAGMWAWKGTTVGGIVVGLKVVRVDGAPVTIVTAIVRGLAAGFSAFVLFLGFFWIAWDREKQGWHDKIAGTYVVRLPRGTPLVMF
jgi:uncharacterized RDD family membrane protein YckC